MQSKAELIQKDIVGAKPEPNVVVKHYCVWFELTCISLYKG